MLQLGTILQNLSALPANVYAQFDFLGLFSRSGSSGHDVPLARAFGPFL